MLGLFWPMLAHVESEVWLLNFLRLSLFIIIISATLFSYILITNLILGSPNFDLGRVTWSWGQIACYLASASSGLKWWVQCQHSSAAQPLLGETWSALNIFPDIVAEKHPTSPVFDDIFLTNPHEQLRGTTLYLDQSWHTPEYLFWLVSIVRKILIIKDSLLRSLCKWDQLLRPGSATDICFLAVELQKFKICRPSSSSGTTTVSLTLSSPPWRKGYMHVRRACRLIERATTMTYGMSMIRNG